MLRPRERAHDNALYVCRRLFAVDMESAAIAQTCHIYGVPFVSFRIISDTPGVDKHIEQYENFWGEMADRSFGVTRRFLMKL